MKFSVCNVLDGIVIEIVKGVVISYVWLDIGGMMVIVLIINDVVVELGLQVGVKVLVVIKVLDVMIGVKDV